MKKRLRTGRKEHQDKTRLLNYVVAAVVVGSVTVIVVLTVLLSGLQKRKHAVRPDGIGSHTQPAPEGIFESEEQILAAQKENLARSVRLGEEQDRLWIQEIKREIAALRSANGTFRLNLGEATSFATLECAIEGANVGIRTFTNGTPISDDAQYYLFALHPYEETIANDAEPVLTLEKAEEIDVQIPLQNRDAQTKLFHKFQLAVKWKGEYLPISKARYISNPEVLASQNYGGRAHSSVKGILVDPHRTSQLSDLGVQYATYNIPLSRIMGPTSNGAHPTITYNYGGRNYAFNGQAIHEYDYIFQILTDKGIDIAAIILNDHPSACPQITHPKARGGSTAPYRMMNAEDEEGMMAIAAVGNFLANRYSGSGHGNVEFWIIGNEVNARKEWNYMEHIDVTSYTKAYIRALRVFYQSIKAANAGAKVYASFDQQWDRNLSGNPDYDARDMLDIMAQNGADHGNFDWGVAFHPYSVPVGQANFWSPNKLVNGSAGTSMITMGNIEVLTSYLAQERMLYAGGIRSVILSELGYTSSKGEDLQAAAIIYAFHKAQTNGHIDAVMFNRQTDASAELAQGLALGLNHIGGGQKKSYTAFKYMDTEQAAQYRSYASDIIGISF